MILRNMLISVLEPLVDQNMYDGKQVCILSACSKKELPVSKWNDLNMCHSVYGFGQMEWFLCLLWVRQNYFVILYYIQEQWATLRRPWQKTSSTSLSTTRKG